MVGVVSGLPSRPHGVDRSHHPSQTPSLALTIILSREFLDNYPASPQLKAENRIMPPVFSWMVEVITMMNATLHRLLGYGLLPLGIIAAASLGIQKPLSSQSCDVYMGTAVTGASVRVDSCSVRRVSSRSVDFTYYLGQMRIQAQAHCPDNTWTTFHDGVTHRPQSAATQNMLNFVCDGSTGGNTNNPGVANSAFVFNPPSNVRTYPSGPILCTLRTQRWINVYGNQGDWFHTDACGSMGMIHNSQIRF